MNARLAIAALVVLSTIGCGPRSITSEDGDEIAESTEGDSESEGEAESEGEEECQPQPDFIPCGPNAACPEGFKCGGYTGHDCRDQPFGDVGCMPVLGDRGAGQACTITLEEVTPMFTWHLDDCDAEGRCLPHANGSLEGTCVPFCEYDGQSFFCEDPSRIGTAMIICLCLQRCDPTAAEPTCEGEFVCGSSQFSNDEFRCSIAGFGPGEGQLGDGCVNSFGCENGLGCVEAELLPDCSDDSGCCSPFCSLDDADSCAELGPGFTCLPFYEQGQAPASLEHVGQCAWP
jgi:hypothetical protein